MFLQLFNDKTDRNDRDIIQTTLTYIDYPRDIQYYFIVISKCSFNTINIILILCMYKEFPIVNV